MAHQHAFARSFPDEDLLKRLTPDESTVPQGHKDDDDD